jgi:hypothetical protein
MPGHPRLAYFATRLEVEEQRTMISQALQAAGTGAMNKAAGLIDEAAQVRLGESGAVTEARAELARREEQQGKIAKLLGHAQTRMTEGRLVEPAEDNALYYLEAARNAGANTATAEPVASALAAALIAEASTATHDGNFTLAKEWLARASEADPGAEALASAEIELAAASDRPGSSRWYALDRAPRPRRSSRRAKTVPLIISANYVRMHPTTRGSMTRSRASRMLRSAPPAAQWPRISSTTRDTTSTP